MALARPSAHGWVKRGVLLGAAAPALSIAFGVARGSLGANPIAEALNQLGLMALALLLLTLVCTPLAAITGWTWAVRARKPLGLAAFAYAALHVSTYAGLDQLLDLGAIFEDVTKRRFILVGFAAFVLLVPLAATSNDRMVRRLGYRRWKLLHRLVYLAASLGVVHFIWRVKQDLTEPLLYAAVLVVLLGLRVALKTRDIVRERARGTGSSASASVPPQAGGPTGKGHLLRELDPGHVEGGLSQ